ncbi:MAG: ATP synthase F1 subunit delta [Solirubrobacterales bacterium]|nr:ATP synthase F1 subunit delta [Solirubrobacterales bacterium]MBV9714541.1 ATP synthase F1 subunit delta [Solirubrobacterales bacterium]
MEEIAEVYARSLFEVAKERGLLDAVREQLKVFAEALRQDRELAIFFFSPYFSTEEKVSGLRRAVDGAEPIFMNFLEALLERHRMPAIFRIQTRYEKLWEDENQLLPVQVTSAIELDEATVASIGEQIGRQAGRKVELSSQVDPEILGGIVLRVGNFILDASIRNRLNQLRKQVAQA